MSITILNYFDQALVDSVRAQAAERAQEAIRAQEAAQTANTTAYGSSFSDVLGQAAASYGQDDGLANARTSDLSAIFTEASNTFGVSVNLLQAIAKAESNFKADAVSSAGAVGIMQLMPATAAAMGVTDSRDAYQNIMGGAKYISQLLSQYSGNIPLALAAYNAGSANVDKYGGIPPFSETQNYVRKVLYYFENGVGTDFSGSVSDVWSNYSDNAALGQTIANLLSRDLNDDTLDALSNLFQTLKTNDSAASDGTGVAAASPENVDSSSSGDEAARSITVTVINGEHTV